MLNKKQQQLIARVWHAGPSAGSVDAPLDLIGTIEGFSPQLYQPSVPATRSRHHGARFGLPSGLRIPAIWTVVGVSLLGCAVGLGAKHGLMPESGVAAAAATNHVAATNNVSSTDISLDRTSAESGVSVADSPAAATEASSVPTVQSPDAMAQDASSLTVMTPQPRGAVNTKVIHPKTLGKPEVMIRVSVDREGRALAFHVLRGDQKKISAALNAARRWSFQPCFGSADCEHLLKFTDYGDASIVQMID